MRRPFLSGLSIRFWLTKFLETEKPRPRLLMDKYGKEIEQKFRW